MPYADAANLPYKTAELGIENMTVSEAYMKMLETVSNCSQQKNVMTLKYDELLIVPHNQPTQSIVSLSEFLNVEIEQLLKQIENTPRVSQYPSEYDRRANLASTANKMGLNSLYPELYSHVEDMNFSEQLKLL